MPPPRRSHKVGTVEQVPAVPAARSGHERVVVEQATGVLAERGRLDPAAAFERLDRYARDHGLRLADLAREVVETTLAAVDVLTVRADKTLHRGDAERR